jgi:hypothetical protein
MDSTGDRAFNRRRAVALIACMILVICNPVFVAGDEGEQVKLSLALPAGEVYAYETETYFSTNFMGMDVNRTQTFKVNLSLMETMEGGAQKVQLEFTEVKSSMIVDDEMREWKPPLDLNGAIIIAEVSSDGEVLGVEPGGYIAGMRSEEDLEDIAELWFVKLPDTLVSVGETWREDIEEAGAGENAAPLVKGYIDYTLKKLEKKNGIAVATIEGKGTVAINRMTPQGVLEGEAEIKGKMHIAIDGGFIVEGKGSSDMKGKIVNEDAPGDKETDTAVTQSYKIKLKK